MLSEGERGFGDWIGAVKSPHTKMRLSWLAKFKVAKILDFFEDVESMVDCYRTKQMILNVTLEVGM